MGHPRSARWASARERSIVSFDDKAAAHAALPLSRYPDQTWLQAEFKNGIAVDTHAARVSRRLKLSTHTDPVKIEQDLLALFPRSRWIDMHHRLVLFGRYTCQARAPRCGECPCAGFCPSRAG